MSSTCGHQLLVDIFLENQKICNGITVSREYSNISEYSDSYHLKISTVLIEKTLDITIPGLTV